MIGRSIRAFIPNRWKFIWRYRRRRTPWDTRITPPEVLEFLEDTPPGRALDLGCGTGTNAIAMARSGWAVTGVDFAPEAIREARRKAADAGYKVDFHVADVTALSFLAGRYDYVLDIGCLFTLSGKDRIRYAGGLARLLRPQGWYMLYAWLPRDVDGERVGIAADEIQSLFQEDFRNIRTVIGEEGGHPSAWYWFRRGPDRAADSPANP